MKTQSGIAGIIALGVALGSFPIQAAHLYAAGNGAVRVYETAANGSLALKQTVLTGAVGAMVTTPGGRFLYTTDAVWLYVYAMLDNGTIQLGSAPVKACDPEGTSDLGMHPTGDYLYTISSSICAFRTDDADGHLTMEELDHAITDGFRLAVHPGGRYIVALGGEGGAAVTMQCNPDGTHLVHAATSAPGFTGDTWETGALTADARFLYVGTYPDVSLPTTGHVNVLALQADGSLKAISAQTVPVVPDRPTSQKILAVGGTFLAVSAGGAGSHLDIYAVANDGSMKLASSAPIEVYAMAGGKGTWGSDLWVATDDGIVSYSVGAGGQLTRIGKAMVDGATVLAFGAK